MMNLTASLTRHVPLFVAATYALVSVTWIFSSDRLLVMIAGDYSTYQSLQTGKGWAFVVASSLVLYFALRYAWRQSEQAHALLNLASALARLGGWRTDLTTGKVEATAGTFAAYAMPKGRFDVDAALRCYSPEDREVLLTIPTRMETERSEISGEFCITALDGTAKWMRLMQRPVIGRDGKLIAVEGAVQDISEIVTLREEAASQASRLRNMIDNMPDAFYLLNCDLHVTYANAAGADDSCIGKPLGAVFPLTEKQLRAPLERMLQDKQPVTVVVETPPDGPIHKVVAYVTPDGIAMHLRDVTDEVRAENALRASEERFRLAGAASQDVLFDWDIAHDRLMWSEAAHRFGYDPAVFPRTLSDWLSRVHPDDRKRMQTEADHVLSPGQPDSWVASYRFLRADGSTAHVLQRALAPRRPDGPPTRMIGTITDVSDLHAEQQRLRAVVDVAADAIFDHDLKRNMVYYSEGMRTAFGHDWVGEQPVPSPWQTMLHPEDRELALHDFQTFCTGPETRWRGEYRMLRADGSYATVRERAVAVRDEQGRTIRVIGSMEDVTEDRRREERIRQSDRIEAIGKLTGGVAHDFNNLLTVIMGNAELIESDTALNDTNRELAAIILRAAERGAGLTAGLLAFARKQPLIPKALDAKIALEEISRLLRRTLPADIALQIETAPDLWLVKADPAQLNAAILNLALNARDAMPDGGRLTIDCANATLDETYVAANPDARTGEFLRLSVTDSGTGMSPDVAKRVFEPFFTTKPHGQGTGMGLSMVHGFVTQSGGHVTIRTEPGQGTILSLFLPRSRTIPAQEAAPPAAPPLSHRNEHVLVVEDNPLLLPHVCEMVAGLGYRVSSAADAEAALTILRRGGVDVLLTDVVLPGGMNGAQLARHAGTVLPGLKVLFTSGYSEDAIIHDGRLDTGVHLLPKPYRRHDLARRLREVIEAA